MDEVNCANLHNFASLDGSNGTWNRITRQIVVILNPWTLILESTINSRTHGSSALQQVAMNFIHGLNI